MHPLPDLGNAAALRRVVNAELRSNSYLLAHTGQTTPGTACVVLDPGLDHAAMDAALEHSGWVPAAVVCTHGHFDHIGGAARLQAKYQIPVYLRAEDAKVAKLSKFLMAAFKIPGKVELPQFSLLHGDAPEVKAAGWSFALHALPGHTPGGAGVTVDGLLFSGDSLYASRIGLSRLPGEDHVQLRKSLHGLFGWIDPDTLVLPGHGEHASVAEILHSNAQLKAFMADTTPLATHTTT